MPWNSSTAMRCKCLNDSDLVRVYLTLWSVAFTKRGMLVLLSILSGSCGNR